MRGREKRQYERRSIVETSGQAIREKKVSHLSGDFVDVVRTNPLKVKRRSVAERIKI